MNIAFFILNLSIFLLNINFPSPSFCSIVSMTDLKKGVLPLGDRMASEFEPALEHIYAKAKKSAMKMSNEKRAQIDSAFMRGRQLIDERRADQAKIQLIQNGKKQFAVGFVGHGNLVDNFLKMKENHRVDSMQSLANLLDDVHYISARERQKLYGEDISQLKPHRFLATDGKGIYELEAGRKWGPRAKGLKGKLKEWWQGRKDAEEGAEREPKVRKLKGNVHVRGYFSEEFKQGLEGTFGGKKPMDMTVEEAHNLHNQVYAGHAKKYLGVSESNRGYFLEKPNWFKNLFKKDRVAPREVEHLNLAEANAIRNEKWRNGPKIVQNLVENGLWEEEWGQIGEGENAELGEIVNGWYLDAKRRLEAESSQTFNGRGKNNIPQVPNRISRKMGREGGWRAEGMDEENF